MSFLRQLALLCMTEKRSHPICPMQLCAPQWRAKPLLEIVSLSVRLNSFQVKQVPFSYAVWKMSYGFKHLDDFFLKLPFFCCCCFVFFKFLSNDEMFLLVLGRIIIDWGSWGWWYQHSNPNTNLISCGSVLLPVEYSIFL